MVQEKEPNARSDTHPPGQRLHAPLSLPISEWLIKQLPLRQPSGSFSSSLSSPRSFSSSLSPLYMLTK